MDNAYNVLAFLYQIVKDAITEGLSTDCHDNHVIRLASCSFDSLLVPHIRAFFGNSQM